MADLHDDEARANSAGGERFYFFSNFLLDGGGDDGAVEDFRHSRPPKTSYLVQVGGSLRVWGGGEVFFRV